MLNNQKLEVAKMTNNEVGNGNWGMERELIGFALNVNDPVFVSGWGV